MERSDLRDSPQVWTDTHLITQILVLNLEKLWDRLGTRNAQKVLLRRSNLRDDSAMKKEDRTQNDGGCSHPEA